LIGDRKTNRQSNDRERDNRGRFATDDYGQRMSHGDDDMQRGQYGNDRRGRGQGW
jgi:hypothetical protein